MHVRLAPYLPAHLGSTSFGTIHSLELWESAKAGQASTARSMELELRSVYTFVPIGV